MKKAIFLPLLIVLFFLGCSPDKSSEEVALEQVNTAGALSVSVALLGDKIDKRIYVIAVCDKEELGPLLLPPQFVPVESTDGTWRLGSLDDWPEIDRKASFGSLDQDVKSDLQIDMNYECIQSTIW